MTFLVQVWELVATILGIEVESTDFIAQLLAPPPLTTPLSVATRSTPIVVATFDLEGSHSMAAVVQGDNDDVRV